MGLAEPPGGLEFRVLGSRVLGFFFFFWGGGGVYRVLGFWAYIKFWGLGFRLGGLGSWDLAHNRSSGFPLSGCWGGGGDLGFARHGVRPTRRLPCHAPLKASSGEPIQDLR